MVGRAAGRSTLFPWLRVLIASSAGRSYTRNLISIRPTHLTVGYAASMSASDVDVLILGAGPAELLGATSGSGG